MLELWGMTELAGPAITHSPYWQPRYGSIGFACSRCRGAYRGLKDPSRSLPPGEAGELMVRGPLVTRGYWNNPQASAETVSTDGWLATGDIARADAEGFLFVVDHKKDLIITAGYNVYPANWNK